MTSLGIRMITTVAVCGVTLMSGALTASASEDQPIPTEVTPLSEENLADLGDRLVNLVERFPHDFGGVVKEDNTMIVFTVSPRATRLLHRFGPHHTAIETRNSPTTLAQLDRALRAAEDSIDEALPNSNSATESADHPIPSVAVAFDPAQGGIVEATLPKHINPAQADHVKQSVERVVPTKSVRVESKDQYVDVTSRFSYGNAPQRGGALIFTSRFSDAKTAQRRGNHMICTSGVPWKKAGANYLITAGHCSIDQHGNRTKYVYKLRSGNLLKIGRLSWTSMQAFQTKKGLHGDLSAYKLNRNAKGVKGQIWRGSGNTQLTRTIKGQRSLPVGSWANWYISGASAYVWPAIGNKVGSARLSSLLKKTRYRPRGWGWIGPVNEVTTATTADQCGVWPGDSGGPVYQAQGNNDAIINGITSGSNSAYKNNRYYCGTLMYYTDIRWVKKDFGGRIVTG